MIQVNSIHHNYPSSEHFTRSHTLTPHDSVMLFCIIDGTNEGIISIIEDHLLETISSAAWSIRETNQDFTYITEHYNSFITSFSKDDLKDVKVLFAMLQGEHLTLSTIWWTSAIFIESNGELIDISIHENKSQEFHSITSGKIPPGSTAYLSSESLENILWSDVIEELSGLSWEKWHSTTEKILERETQNNIHITRLSHRDTDLPNPAFSRNKRKQSDIIRDTSILAIEYIRSKRVWDRTKGIIQKLPSLENKKYLYHFLAIGIVLLFALAYSLISSILYVLNTSTSDNKNLLIQAKTLIDDGEKLASNPAAFNTKITEAEKILFDLRKEQTHILDTQELLTRISTLKKQVYDIQEIDMTHLSSIVPFNSTDINPIGIFEKDKKLTIVWEKWIILEYVTGDTSLKVTPYPSNEIAKSFDIGEDGSVYILTASNNILSPRRDDVVRINVTGQNTWEDSLSIKTFNGNIYLLETNKNQIQKHKPGVNGFSQKSNLISKAQPGIFDFSIDGGIYLYMEDGKIFRYFSDKDTINSIVLNKIPWEWSLNTTLSSTFITKSNLSYSYILNGNRIWIFQPNSKRFKDVTAWEYKWQFELKTEETVKNIYVPRHGYIYVTTNQGIYELKFEFIDGKIIFK